jgi:hypothetical protein
MSADDDFLGYAQIATLATERGVPMKTQTVRGYRHRGALPDPDDLTFPDRPRWRRSTVVAWLDSRPGQGTRTDLQPKG